MTSKTDTPDYRELLKTALELFENHEEFHKVGTDVWAWGIQASEALSAMPSETALTDEKGRPMTYWGGAASPDKEDDAWRAAALRLGEQLAPTGPNWYYAMTPTQWLEWCRSALPSAVAACSRCGATADKYLQLGCSAAPCPMNDKTPKPPFCSLSFTHQPHDTCDGKATQSAIVRRSPDEIDLICDAYIAKTAEFQCPPKFYSHLREALHAILRPTDRTVSEENK